MRAWGVGVLAIVGVACVGTAALRRQLPLLATGIAAGALAALPAWMPAGELMARVPVLFPSRFPAGDYKVFVALALVVLAAEGWRDLAGTREQLPWLRLIAISVALAAGAYLAPGTHADPAVAPWLVAAIVLAAVGLAAANLRPGVVATALVLLLVADGARMALGYGNRNGQSPWLSAPEQSAAARARDPYVRRLDRTLDHPPTRRPERQPPEAPVATHSYGTPQDATSYVGDGFRLGDYGGTVTRARWIALHTPRSAGLC